MSRRRIAFVVFALLAVAFASTAATTARAADLNVTLVASGSMWHQGSASAPANPTITVVVGDTLRLTIVNADSFDHTFTAPQFFSGDKALAIGATILVNITTSSSDIGSWQFFCNIPGHAPGTYPNKQGMVGTIAVAPSTGPPTPGGVSPLIIGIVVIVIVVAVAAAVLLMRRKKPA